MTECFRMRTVESMRSQAPPVVMEELTDPEELTRARAQRERFDRNSAWLQAYAQEVYAESRLGQSLLSLQRGAIMLSSKAVAR